MVAHEEGGRVGPLGRLAIEAGPLGVFFLGNQLWHVMAATALFMAATFVSVAVSYRLERRWPLMPLVAGAFVLVFGGLTLALEDDTFIKIKPTITHLLFAAVLFAGLALRRPFLRVLLGTMLQVTERGWRLLTWRWAFFFLFEAALNEVVWRNFSTEFWAGFKLFGNLPLAMAFAMAQVPLILRYQMPPGETAPAGSASL